MTQINLLPWRERERKEQKARFGVIISITIGLALLLTVILHFHARANLNQERNRNTYLETELGQEGGILLELNKKKKEQATILTELNFLISLRKQGYDVVRVLDTLTRVVPEAVSFSRIARAGNVIMITGKSNSNLQVTQLMRNIASFPIFKQPDLTEIIAKENVAGEQRFFQLKVELKE